MKTKEELTALKEEVETLNKKLTELTPDELTQVTGGNYTDDVRKYLAALLNPEEAFRSTEIIKDISFKPLP